MKPINDFTAAGSPNKAAFDAGFLSFFGFTQNDPAAANITAAQMDNFMTTVVEPQFLGAGWQGHWSNATDQRHRRRIALNETVETSVSANNDGMRKLAMAAATVTDMFDSNVSDDRPQGAADPRRRAWSAKRSATSPICSSSTGIVENRVKNASDRINMQVDLFADATSSNWKASIPTRPRPASTSLLQQIETSYALTARIQQLSLAEVPDLNKPRYGGVNKRNANVPVLLCRHSDQLGRRRQGSRAAVADALHRPA